MNILIQQTKAFPQRANSFYWFYAQLTEGQRFWQERSGAWFLDF